jgi:hypothetical protein
MNKMRFSLALTVATLIVCSVATGAARKVVTEMFTSTTCAPCYAADNYYYHTWYPNYGGAELIINIAYHVWWPSPGNDPMYLSNPTPVQIRNTYYQPSGGYAPRMFIDGFVDGGSSYSSWPGMIEPRFLDPSPISITLTGTRVGNILNMNAQIYAEVAVNSSNWRVHWVLVESGINEPQNSPNGYVPFIHNFAHRAMYPDANGSPISISQGQTVSIDRTITLNTSWVAANCHVIVFVQNNADKKVQNAEIIEVSSITGVANQDERPLSFALAQNYPNPFNPQTTIEFSMPREEFVTVKVYNMLGQEVKTLVNEIRQAGPHKAVLDDVNLPSGLYTYQMIAGTFRETRKMILLR